MEYSRLSLYICCMSINIFRTQSKTTGNFFTESIKDDLSESRILVYIDPVAGFEKHHIDNVDNVLCIVNNDLTYVYMLIEEILKQQPAVIYFDHFECMCAEESNPLSCPMATAKYRHMLFQMIGRYCSTAYIVVCGSEFQSARFYRNYTELETLDKSMKKILRDRDDF